MAASLAHISDFATATSFETAYLLAGAAFCAALVLQNSVVKHQGFGLHQVRPAAAVLVVLLVGFVIAPVPGKAQSQADPQGLPDLISDPPSIDRTRLVRTPEGDVIRVMTFDGYIHNIGTGKLEVSGNPQLENGMEQRVFDGEEWTTVGTPTVRFETDDGHNHFHLIRAIDYALWSNDRTEQVTDAAKVGFCLVDSEQIEEGFDSNYLIEVFNYCGVDDPDSTDLVMGITPGWRDTYDANVTLQWIDISNTQPGLYWISAETDPNNEIVESNEDNNAIVFSARRYAVDGYVARELGTQTAGEPIQLKSSIYGSVGEQAFVIETGPQNGSLDVPVGLDILGADTVVYSPDPGFSGTDTFRYYAHDTASLFPIDPFVVEVTITVDTPGAADDPANADDDTTNATDLSVTDPGPQEAPLYSRTEVAFELQNETDATPTPRWYASNLPPGLSMDPSTGVVSGVPTFAAEFDSTVMAWLDDGAVEQSVQWTTTEEGGPPSLAMINDLSTSSELLRLPIGSSRDDATYRGIGLPEGGVVVSNQALLSGVGREVGTFQVRVEEVVDEEVVNSIEFAWTIRPSARPAFPL